MFSFFSFLCWSLFTRDYSMPMLPEIFYYPCYNGYRWCKVNSQLTQILGIPNELLRKHRTNKNRKKIYSDTHRHIEFFCYLTVQIKLQKQNPWRHSMWWIFLKEKRNEGKKRKKFVDIIWIACQRADTR